MGYNRVKISELYVGDGFAFPSDFVEQVYIGCFTGAHGEGYYVYRPLTGDISQGAWISDGDTEVFLIQ